MDYDTLRHELEQEILDGGEFWIDAGGDSICLDLHLTAHRVTQGQASLIGEHLDPAAVMSMYAAQIINRITQRRTQREKVAQQLGGESYTAAEGIRKDSGRNP